MEKLSLETLTVESFATAPIASARGTIHARDASGTACDLTYNGCPTQYCATVPVTCATAFAPQCTGTTCTG